MAFSVTVHVVHSNIEVEGATQNVSQNGLCVTLRSAPPLGELVEVRLPARNEAPAVTLSARIVWSTQVDNEVQIGLQFHAPTKASLDQLMALLAA